MTGIQAARSGADSGHQRLKNIATKKNFSKFYSRPIMLLNTVSLL
jgi:hypothetical protein